MTLRRVLRIGLLCGALAACAHKPVGGAVALVVEANVPDATVWVDDVLVGKAADWSRGDRRIRAGFHRIEIRSPGYYSTFHEVEQPDGGRATVKADLRPLLD